jgi:phenylpyruvate tautomerase PptA (4-oxalocrotonate tautomerase family)
MVRLKSVPDVIKVILRILMEQESAIRVIIKELKKE